MNETTAYALIAVAAALIAVLIARRSGPRITTIETRRDDDRDDDKSQEF